MQNNKTENYLFNQITIVGRAGSDAEFKTFDSGSSKAEVSLAVNRKGSGPEDVTDWFKVVFWGKQAEIAGEYVKKGTLVGVEGNLQLDQWTDRNSGEKRESCYVKAITLKLLSSKNNREG